MNTEPPSLLRFAGAVIAGGRSSRMGVNKAEILVGGVPLWRRQETILAQAGARERVLSLGHGSTWRPAGVAVVYDGAPETGPLGGLDAVLSWASALGHAAVTHVMVAAVDLPKVTAGWYVELTRLCANGRGAVGRWPDEAYYEPLAAIYPRELRDDVGAALAAGSYSLQRLVDKAVRDGRLAVLPITSESSGQFVNWNRPEDWSE